MKIILFIPLLFSISCQGQQDILNQKMYVPTEVSYLGKKFPLALKDLTIMNYTYVNPLIARQVYDKSKEEFAILNSNILLSKKDCKHLIDNYVNKKTDSTYSEIYYNPYSNKKLIFQKISENTFKLKLEDDEMYLRCICLPSQFISLSKDFKEAVSEFNLPGGYILDRKEVAETTIIQKLDSLDAEKSITSNIFLFNEKIRKINTPKSPIYFTPNTPTKMYLLKNDEVEVLEEKEDWLRIRYYGKKTIEGWIKKSDVE